MVIQGVLLPLGWACTWRAHVAQGAMGWPFCRMAVQRVMSGGRYISSALAEHLAGTISGEGVGSSHETLSNRELLVLRMIASGKTIKEISAELALSVKTVATYRSRISEKMGLSTNVEFARYALRHGLVD